MLYAPGLTGHPQVYCRVIGDILLEQGAYLIIATGQTENLNSRWPDLSPFVGRDDIEILSTRSYSATGDEHLKAEELFEIQKDRQVDSTLFIEPEHFREEFIRIFRGQAKRLRGYNAGIFGRTTEWYPGEEFHSGRKIGPFDTSLRSQLGKVRRRFSSPWTIDRYFFEKVLIKEKLLDAVIVKDERLAEQYEDKVHWLPEIYKVFNPVESGSGQREYETLKPKLDAFLSTHDPRNLVLFFGAGAWYKGYDYFIQLLVDDTKSAGIHAGAGIRKMPGKKFIGEPEKNREELLDDGRLFETNGYVESAKFIEEVFRTGPRFVSTHRLTVSSGTMLQALDYGLPVLVPDTGLVGHRARTNGLGRTYRYGDSADLARQWKSFKKEPVEQFQEAIRTFMRRFDREAVQELFIRTLIRQAV